MTFSTLQHKYALHLKTKFAMTKSTSYPIVITEVVAHNALKTVKTRKTAENKVMLCQY